MVKDYFENQIGINSASLEDPSYLKKLTKGISFSNIVADLQHSIVLKEALNLIYSSSFVSYSDFYIDSLIENKIKKISYVKINDNHFVEDIDPKEIDLNEYYLEHKDLFSNPETVKLDYLLMKKSDVAEGINVSDEDIELYYNENTDKFFDKGVRSVSHILVDTNELAEEILEKLNSGKDFGELAKEFSKDSSSSKSKGFLASSSYEDSSSLYKDHVFGLGSNDVYSIFNSYMGFHVFKVDIVKEGFTKKLESVRESIVADIKKEKIDQFLQEKKSLLEDSSYENPESLKFASDSSGIPILSTESFDSNNVPADFNTPDIIKVIFNKDFIDEKLNSDVYPSGDNYVVFRINSHSPKSYKDIDEVKDEVLKYAKKDISSKRVSSLVSNAVDSSSRKDLEGKFKFSNISFSRKNSKDLDLPDLLVSEFNLMNNGTNKFSQVKVDSDNYLIYLDEVIAYEPKSTDIDLIPSDYANTSYQKELASILHFLKKRKGVVVYEDKVKLFYDSN